MCVCVGGGRVAPGSAYPSNQFPPETVSAWAAMLVWCRVTAFPPDLVLRLQPKPVPGPGETELDPHFPDEGPRHPPVPWNREVASLPLLLSF